MTRGAFVEFLLDNDCEIVREANQGYWVFRNTNTKRISGLPVGDPPKPATICRICKNLGIENLPEDDDVLAAKAVVDYAHKKHSSD